MDEINMKTTESWNESETGAKSAPARETGSDALALRFELPARVDAAQAHMRAEACRDHVPLLNWRSTRFALMKEALR